MTSSLSLDPATSALLVMDFQTAVVEMVPADKDALLSRTANLIEAARKASMKVIGEPVGTVLQADTCATGATLPGVDVSVYDGTVDWARSRRTGAPSGSRRPRKGRPSRTRSSPPTGRP